ncbi:MAG: putative glycoside hydrolase [Thermodesulfobacteriota bacterium]
MKRLIPCLLILAVVAGAAPVMGESAPAAPAKMEATPATPAQTEAATAAPPKKEAAPASSPKTETPAGLKTIAGKIVDAKTKAPIQAAAVTLGDKAVRTDKEGAFRLEGTGETLKVRAPGYAKRELPLAQVTANPGEIPLTPFKIKALYLTVYGIHSRKLRNAALDAIKENNLNALVIDVKGDRGFVPFPVDIPLVQEIGANKPVLVKDIKATVAALKEKNLYLIARIVVFKDDPLAAAKPAWAVKAKRGAVFRDREKLRWVDPFRKEVWDYNIAIAKKAAEAGFDEVQFDYVRFPDSRKTTFSKPANEDTRTAAITAFLKAAYKALEPYDVMVAADIFGYVCWNTNDTDIGQKIHPAIEAVDLVCPMVYPSGYHLGIPNYRNPVNHPYKIVYLSLKKAQERTGASPLRFRPWLQAFRDYAFGRKIFGPEEMRLQIKAADDFGSSGWMFWNPRNIYPKTGYKQKAVSSKQ